MLSALRNLFWVERRSMLAPYTIGSILNKGSEEQRALLVQEIEGGLISPHYDLGASRPLLYVVLSLNNDYRPALVPVLLRNGANPNYPGIVIAYGGSRYLNESLSKLLFSHGLDLSLCDERSKKSVVYPKLCEVSEAFPEYLNLSRLVEQAEESFSCRDYELAIRLYEEVIGFLEEFSQREQRQDTQDEYTKNCANDYDVRAEIYRDKVQTCYQCIDAENETTRLRTTPSPGKTKQN